MVTLVLLPGLDGTGLLLADFAASFGPDVKVVVASYPSDVVLGYAELEPIARSFLPQDQPFILLGESFSGPIAISIAASRPPGLLGVVLCCSFARSPRPLLAVFRSLFSAFPVAAVPAALTSFFVHGRFSSSVHRRALAAALARVSPAVLRARACAALSVDVSGLLTRVAVPLLYLRASEDRVVPESASHQVVSLAPSTAVVEFPAPHFLLQTLPEEAACAVREFVVPLAHSAG